MSADAPGGARGELFIVSAPSGAGKTSLVRALVSSDAQMSLSTSHTTRAQRAGEVDGDHYHFVDEGIFREMVERDEFLEHATVFGHAYGTSRSEVEGRLARGLDVVLEIDWQGARQVRARMPGSVGVFVLPPSVAQLEARLRSRALDDDAVIDRRMRAAVDEIEHFDEFDYLVVNDVFETALAELQAVVTCRRLKRERQERRHRALLGALLAGRRRS